MIFVVFISEHYIFSLFFNQINWSYIYNELTRTTEPFSSLFDTEMKPLSSLNFENDQYTIKLIDNVSPCVNISIIDLCSIIDHHQYVIHSEAAKFDLSRLFRMLGTFNAVQVSIR